MIQGDAVLYPTGYSDNKSVDDRYMDLKGEIEDMMKNASFKVMSMSMNTLYEWYGRVTGTSVDYASTVSCRRSSYCEHVFIYFLHLHNI